MNEQDLKAVAKAAGMTEAEVAAVDLGDPAVGEQIRTMAALRCGPLGGLGEIKWETEAVIGTQESCVIYPSRVVMTLRGGGIGANAWVARITGTHEKWGVARDFVEAKKSLSGSGRSGWMRWNLPCDGVYEYRSLCVSSSHSRSGFFVVKDAQVSLLGNRKIAVREWAARTGGEVG